jgi:hypothetical protein
MFALALLPLLLYICFDDKHIVRTAFPEAFCRRLFGGEKQKFVFFFPSSPCLNGDSEWMEVKAKMGAALGFVREECRVLRSLSLACHHSFLMGFSEL